MWEITAQVPAAIAPYPRWAAEPGVHCQTHCVEESETSHHGWEGWQNTAPNQNPAGLPLRFFKVQCLAKVTFINLSWVATHIVWGTWVNKRTQQTQTMAAQLRPAGQEGPRSQTQLKV